MSDQENQPVFQIQRVYLKDMSIEQPNSPAIFLEKELPGVEVDISVGLENLAESVFECTVTVTVTAKIGEKVAYLVEGTQAGIFEVRNIPEEQAQPLLGIGCPSIIYPYLRSNIADAITRTGFPTIHLAEINFEAFYQDQLEASKNQRATNPNEVH